MPSKTSTSHKKAWFSKAMFLQSYSNFAPIPIVYFILVFMILPMNIFMSDMDLMEHNQLMMFLADFPSFATSFGLPAAFLTGCMSAMLSFRYLHNNRSANMVHSMPVRREALFVTQYLAGLSFVLIPNLLLFFFTLAALAFQGVFYFTPVILFFLMHSAVYFFFYSFGVLCSNMTGSVGGVPMFFLAFNFMAIFVATLLSPLLELFYVGSYSNVYSMPWVEKLTPTMSFAYAARMEENIDVFKHNVFLSQEQMADYLLQPSDISYYIREPMTFVSLMVVGVLFVLGAMWLYHIRHIETAGEAVAISWLKPVFRFLISVLGGLSLGLMSVLIINSSANFTDQEITTILPFASLLWGVVFALVAEMILQKSFRVLQHWKKVILPVLSVAMIYSVLVFDFFGYESYVPPYSMVQDIVLSNVEAYPRDSVNLDALPVKDGRITEEAYQQVSEIHLLTLARALEGKEQNNSSGGYVENLGKNLYLPVTYYKNDGTRTERFYYVRLEEEQISTEGSLEQSLLSLLHDPDMMAYRYEIPRILDSKITEMTFLHLYSKEYKGYGDYHISEMMTDLTLRELDELYVAIVEALEEDLAEGNIGQKYLNFRDLDFLEEGYITSLAINIETDANSPYYVANEVDNGSGYLSRGSRLSNTTKYFSLTTKAVHTLGVLEEYGLLEDYDLKTNYERMEYEKELYSKTENLEELSTHSWVYTEHPDFDPDNVLSFAPVIYWLNNNKP